jgi:hypothetical protein
MVTLQNHVFFGFLCCTSSEGRNILIVHGRMEDVKTGMWPKCESRVLNKFLDDAIWLFTNTWLDSSQLQEDCEISTLILNNVAIAVMTVVGYAYGRQIVIAFTRHTPLLIITA